MTIRRPPFDASGIAAAPDVPGVYRLYRGARVACIGMAAGGATIRSELERRWKGQGFKRMPGITAYDCEAVGNALTAYHRFLALHAALVEGGPGTPFASVQRQWPTSPTSRVRKSRFPPEESNSREA